MDKYSSCVRVSLTFMLLLIIFSQLSSSTESGYRGITSMQKTIDSREMLREMREEYFGRMKHENRREMESIHREAPEGPDPHHH